MARQMCCDTFLVYHYNVQWQYHHLGMGHIHLMTRPPPLGVPFRNAMDRPTYYCPQLVRMNVLTVGAALEDNSLLHHLAPSRRPICETALAGALQTMRPHNCC